MATPFGFCRDGVLVVGLHRLFSFPPFLDYHSNKPATGDNQSCRIGNRKTGSYQIGKASAQAGAYCILRSKIRSYIGLGYGYGYGYVCTVHCTVRLTVHCTVRWTIL